MTKLPSLGACIPLWKRRLVPEALATVVTLPSTLMGKSISQLLAGASTASNMRKFLTAMECNTGRFHTDLAAALTKLGFKGNTGLEPLIAEEREAIQAGQKPDSGGEDEPEAEFLEDLQKAERESVDRRGVVSVGRPSPSPETSPPEGGARGGPERTVPQPAAGTIITDQRHPDTTTAQVPTGGAIIRDTGDGDSAQPLAILVRDESPRQIRQNRTESQAEPYLSLLKIVEDMKRDNDARMETLLMMITSQAENRVSDQAKRRRDDEDTGNSNKALRIEDQERGRRGEDRETRARTDNLDGWRSPTATVRTTFQAPAPAPAATAPTATEATEEDYVGQVRNKVLVKSVCGGGRRAAGDLGMMVSEFLFES
jgi:hypothetical protein